jgi:ComF family protein
MGRGRQPERTRPARIAGGGPRMLRMPIAFRSFDRPLAAAGDLLFPPRCLLCRRDLLRNAAADPRLPRHFCRGCAAELTADVDRCDRCGGATAGGCRRCRHRPPPWRGMAVLSGYDDRLREAVLGGKRASGEPLAAALGRLLVIVTAGRLAAWNLDGVVAVPMHWLRRAMRGTSAADVMAAAIGRSLGLPRLQPLRRARATVMQNTLPRPQRAANVHNAFRRRHAVAGRRLLLVDDVVTTGATAAACTRELLAAGAAAVYVAAAAKAEATHPGPAEP